MLPRVLNNAVLSLGIFLLPATACPGEDATAATDNAANVRTDALGDPLPEKALLRFGTKRFQHPSSLLQMSLSHNEEIVVSLDNDWLIGWDSDNGKELWRKRRASPGTRLTSAGYGLQPMAIVPETGDVVTGHGPGKIAFWNPVTGESSTVNVANGMTSKSIDVSPGSGLIALGDADRMMVCDLSGQLIYEKRNQPEAKMTFGGNDRDRMKFGGDFSYGRFSPDAKLLALVNSEKPNTIQLLKATNGDLIRELEGKDRIVRIDFSPDSRRIVATERDIAARLYDVASGERQWEFIIPADGAAECYTSAVSYRPDGKQIAVGAPIGPDNTIRLLDPETGNETARLTGSGWKPWSLQFTRDSQMLFGSGWDGVIRRWDLNKNTQLARPGGVRATSICAMSRNGKHLAFVDDSANIHLVDVSSGRTLRQLNLPNTTWGQVVFSHDGRWLAGGGVDQKNVQVAIWDLASAQKTHHWKWPKGKDPHSEVEALSFSANGRRIAAAVFRQDAAYVWDIPTNSQIAKVEHRNPYGLDLDGDGTTLVTAGWDKHIRVWDCDTGKETQSLRVQIGNSVVARDDTRMYGVKLSNDQTMIATVDMTGSIRLFDRDLKPVSVINDVGFFTFGALQFSRNDLWIAVGTRDGVKLYDVDSGKLLWKVNEHEEYIYTVDFGARDRTLLSGGTDGVCYLWDLQAGFRAKKASHEVLLTRLRDSDGRDAYDAYWQLTKTPEQTAELLVRTLTEATARDVNEADIRKQIVALGAPEFGIVNEARHRLLNWGPAVWKQLSERLATGTFSESKRSFLKQTLRRTKRRTRRQVALLSELETPVADEAIEKLLEVSPSEAFSLMLNAAKSRRGTLRSVQSVNSTQ